MNPTILGVIGPGFLNQVPTLLVVAAPWVSGPGSIGLHIQSLWASTKTSWLLALAGLGALGVGVCVLHNLLALGFRVGRIDGIPGKPNNTTNYYGCGKLSHEDLPHT